MTIVPDVPINQIWQDALDGWVLHMQFSNFSPTTVRSRRSAGKVLARTMISLGRSDPAEVTKNDLVSYMIARQKGSTGPEGASTHFQNVRSFWTWWSEDAEAPNPLRKVSAPKVGPLKPPAVITKDELNSLLAACDGTDLESLRNRAIILTLASTGLRRMELAALVLDDVNLAKGTIEVRRGKGGKSRTAFLSSAKAVLALHRYLRRRAKETRTDDHVFVNLRTRKGLSPSGVSQIIDGIGERAGVDLHPHLLRHYWADANLTGGMAETNLLTLAGWSSTAMLSRYGASRKTERAIEAAQAIADLV